MSKNIKPIIGVISVAADPNEYTQRKAQIILAHRRRVPSPALAQLLNGEDSDWSASGWHARRWPMGAKPGDKTQVPQQYGCQYKFDPCNMSFSPRNLTSVSVVSRYARRDVTFACPAMRRWQRGSTETGARQPERFLRKQVRDPSSSIRRLSATDRLVMSILRSDRYAAILRASLTHSRPVRETRSLGVSLACRRRHRHRRCDIQQRRVLASSSPPHSPFSFGSVLRFFQTDPTLRHPQPPIIVYLIIAISLFRSEIMFSGMPEGSLPGVAQLGIQSCLNKN